MISNLTHRAARALRGRGFDMSRVPDGHVLRRMWAKAGAEEAAPGETKPPEVSFGPSDVIVIGGEPATVEIETEHVDPAETCDAVDGSATSSNDSDDNGAEYERERDAMIARNKQRMAHLGIDTLSREVGTDGENRKKNKSASADARRRATKLARTSEQHVAPRRSTRSRTLQNPGVVDDVSEEALIALGETVAALRARQTRRAASTKENSTDSHPTPPPEVFEESAVMRYACRASSSQNNASNNEAHFTKGRCATKNERLRGWEQDNVTFADPKMKKGFYALDVRDGDDHGLSDTTKQSLMVGGGDGGRVAVWALHGNDNDRDYNEKEMDDADTDDTTEDTDAVLPLASWVGHRGWCSHVQFFQNHPRGCPLVLTCGGMDGAAQRKVRVDVALERRAKGGFTRLGSSRWLWYFLGALPFRKWRRFDVVETRRVRGVGTFNAGFKIENHQPPRRTRGGGEMRAVEKLWCQRLRFRDLRRRRERACFRRPRDTCRARHRTRARRVLG